MARPARVGAVCLAALAALTWARAEPLKEVVYNRVSKATANLDRVVVETYGLRYGVRPIQEDDTDYSPPQVASGKLPSVVLDEAGKPIRGYALLLYLIKADGSVVEPVVLRSTDVRLDGPAKAALLRARFKAATWHGRSISTVAGQEFEYGSR